ncbi:hypothetical protein HDU98_010931 [Podochytrium sp. JEL0797]|nr:hypothetical protein HDU98_010931 [Podochytrium sp. JEL0797]
MQFFVAALALIASVSAQSTSAPVASAAVSTGAAAVTTAAAGSSAVVPAGTGSGNTCTTSAGGSISIISPLKGSVNQANATLSITWNSNGADPAFQAAGLAFTLVDATNVNNALPISQLSFVPAAQPLVSAGKAVVAIPASVATGSNYALRSEYKDGPQWRYCFSTVFTINAAAPVAVPVATTKSGASAAYVAAAGAVVAALAL